MVSLIFWNLAQSDDHSGFRQTVCWMEMSCLPVKMAWTIQSISFTSFVEKLADALDLGAVISVLTPLLPAWLA